MSESAVIGRVDRQRGTVVICVQRRVLDPAAL